MGRRIGINGRVGRDGGERRIGRIRGVGWKGEICFNGWVRKNRGLKKEW